MKPLRWWVAIGTAVLALAFGIVPYVMLTGAAKMPLGLRDNPWPMEVAAALAALASIGGLVLAYRQKRARVVATIGASIAAIATVLFVLLVHVFSFGLPPAPRELAIGTQAPEFTLPDESGQEVALASTRGHATLLVFYRGYW